MRLEKVCARVRRRVGSCPLSIGSRSASLSCQGSQAQTGETVCGVERATWNPMCWFRTFLKLYICLHKVKSKKRKVGTSAFSLCTGSGTGNTTRDETYWPQYNYYWHMAPAVRRGQGAQSLWRVRVVTSGGAPPTQIVCRRRRRRPASSGARSARECCPPTSAAAARGPPCSPCAHRAWSRR